MTFRLAPPRSTVQGYFYDWRDRGLLHEINHALLMVAREAEGREASPSAGVIDSQSVKTTESGGVCGYDAGKSFEVIPRPLSWFVCKPLPCNGWVVERTFAWLGRCRRLAKDWEKSILSAESWLLIAHIRLVTRRIARH